QRLYVDRTELNVRCADLEFEQWLGSVGVQLLVELAKVAKDLLSSVQGSRALGNRIDIFCQLTLPALLHQQIVREQPSAAVENLPLFVGEARLQAGKERLEWQFRPVEQSPRAPLGGKAEPDSAVSVELWSREE